MTPPPSSLVRESHLLGIRFWAQAYIYQTPNFEVFEYVGKDTSTGLFYFKARKGGAIVGKNHHQLMTSAFYPFCIDTARIEGVLAVAGGSYANL